MKTVNDFLKQMKIKCEAKAKQMNALELSAWNANPEHFEHQLKTWFGFTDKTLAERKKELSA